MLHSIVASNEIITENPPRRVGHFSMIITTLPESYK